MRRNCSQQLFEDLGPAILDVVDGTTILPVPEVDACFDDIRNNPELFEKFLTDLVQLETLLGTADVDRCWPEPDEGPYGAQLAFCLQGMRFSHYCDHYGLRQGEDWR